MFCIYLRTINGYKLNLSLLKVLSIYAGYVYKRVRIIIKITSWFVLVTDMSVNTIS